MTHLEIATFKAFSEPTYLRHFKVKVNLKMASTFLSLFRRNERHALFLIVYYKLHGSMASVSPGTNNLSCLGAQLCNEFYGK